MRKILIFAVALFVCSSVSAQKIEDFKARLAEQVINASIGMVGEVVVHEVGTAAEVVRTSDATKKVESVKGFRIVIFFDNSSTARAKAEEAIMNFNLLYPDVHSHMDYENPYFKVLVGGCITSEEAIVLLGRIKHNFPKAYITREDIKLEELTRPKMVVNPDTGDTPAVPTIDNTNAQ